MSSIPQTKSSTDRRQPRPTRGSTVLLIVIPLLGGLLFYAAFRFIDYQFTLLQETVETQTAVAVAEIQHDNNARIDILAETLAGVTAEMETVKMSLEEAGLAISASTSTESNLQQQLEELERQLVELQQAIRLLQENQ